MTYDDLIAYYVSSGLGAFALGYCLQAIITWFKKGAERI